MSALEIVFSYGGLLARIAQKLAAASARYTECEVLLGVSRCFQPQESAEGKAAQKATNQEGP